MSKMCFGVLAIKVFALKTQLFKLLFVTLHLDMDLCLVQKMTSLEKT